MRGKESSEVKLKRRSFIKSLVALPLFASALNLSAGAADSIKKDFSFVYLNDVHLTSGVPDQSYLLLQESQLFLQDSIKAINALKPDFVIFGGDQVETIGKNGSNWQFFVDVVQGLACPWYFVLGESDVSGKPPLDKMREFGPDFKGRGISASTSYWSADPVQNVHLIGLDSSQANSNAGDISEEQLKWLKDDLAANKGKFTIVISHHPLLPPHPYDGGPPWDEYILPNGSDVREILGTSNDVRLVLSGHLFLNKIQLERDVYHISTAGISVYPCQYKYFRVSKSQVLMESFEVPLSKLVKKGMEALQNSALASKMNRRKPSEALQTFAGSPTDQNAVLTLLGARSISELSKKQIKEDQEKQDAELERLQEEAANKGKKPGGKKSKNGKKEKSRGKAKDTSAENKDSASEQSEESREKDPKKGSGSRSKNSSTSSKKTGARKNVSSGSKKAADGPDGPANPAKETPDSTSEAKEPVSQSGEAAENPADAGKKPAGKDK